MTKKKRLEDKIDDILKETEMIGDMLEASMGKERFERALKKMEERDEEE